MNETLKIQVLDERKWNVETLARSKGYMSQTFVSIYRRFNFKGMYPFVNLQTDALIYERKPYPMIFKSSENLVQVSSDIAYLRLKHQKYLETAIAVAYFAGLGASMFVCVARNNNPQQKFRHIDPTQDKSIIQLCRNVTSDVIEHLFEVLINVN